MIVWLEGADGAVGEVGDEATSCWRMVAYAYNDERKINQDDQEKRAWEWQWLEVRGRG
jgi:hypothetical protein